MQSMNRRSFMKGVTAAALAPAVLQPSSVAATADSKSSSAVLRPGASLPLGGTFVDVASAQPASGLTDDYRVGHWRKTPYRLSNGEEFLTGTMLIIGPESSPPEIVVDPGLEGPHEIYIGIHTQGAHDGPRPIRIKLDDDPCYVLLGPDGPLPNGVQDCRFRAVDMTGRKIHFSQYDCVMYSTSGIAYIRAVPIDESRLDIHNQKGIRLAAMNDGHGPFWLRKPQMTEDEIWEDLYCYKNSPVTALYYCITGADQCNYPTKVGCLLGEGLTDFPELGDRYYTENLQGLFKQGVDPVESVLKFCRELGIECQLSIRPEAFALYPPYDGFFMSPFYRDHPEWRCVDRDGRSISRMSYAYPEVQEHMLKIVDELVAYAPDGINFLFCRGVPLVLYEAPFRDEFQTRHGVAPETLAEDDPRLLALRSDIMTGFMREVRKRTSAVSGKKIEITAMLLSDQAANEFYGLDVLRWLEEGLLDEVAASVYDINHHVAHPDCGYLIEPCKKSACRLAVNFQSRAYPSTDWVAKAAQFRSEGSESFSVWDTISNQHRPVEWARLQQIGLVDEVLEQGALAIEPVVLPFLEFGGMVMDKYPNSWAF